jgi:hypothetical protein
VVSVFILKACFLPLWPMIGSILKSMTLIIQTMKLMEQFIHLRYYEVPADILEDEDELSEWVEKALAVAARKQKKKKKKK